MASVRSEFCVTGGRHSISARVRRLRPRPPAVPLRRPTSSSSGPDGPRDGRGGEAVTQRPPSTRRRGVPVEEPTDERVVLARRVDQFRLDGVHLVEDVVVDRDSARSLRVMTTSSKPPSDAIEWMISLGLPERSKMVLASSSFAIRDVDGVEHPSNVSPASSADHSPESKSRSRDARPAGRPEDGLHGVRCVRRQRHRRPADEHRLGARYLRHREFPGVTVAAAASPRSWMETSSRGLRAVSWKDSPWRPASASAQTTSVSRPCSCSSDRTRLPSGVSASFETQTDGVPSRLAATATLLSVPSARRRTSVAVSRRSRPAASCGGLSHRR